MIAYTSDADAQHFCDTLREHYPITEDWKAEKYCGIDLQWNYEKRYVDISMKG